MSDKEKVDALARTLELVELNRQEAYEMGRADALAELVKDLCGLCRLGISVTKSVSGKFYYHITERSGMVPCPAERVHFRIEEYLEKPKPKRSQEAL